VCPIYAGRSYQLGSFTNVLESVISNWYIQNTTGNNTITNTNCDYNSILSEWFVDMSINGTELQYPFFNGVGYYNYPGQNCLPATPCLSQWTTALDFCLSQIITLGYDYRYETENGVITDVTDPKAFYVRIWNTNCSDKPLKDVISIKMGINFTITCQ
jgi:hypothetical protein